MTSLHSLLSPSSTSHIHLSPGLLQPSPNWFPGFHSGFLSFLPPPEYYLFKIRKMWSCHSLVYNLSLTSRCPENQVQILPMVSNEPAPCWPRQPHLGAILHVALLTTLFVCRQHLYYLCSSNILILLPAAQTQVSSSHTLHQCPRLSANLSPPCVSYFFLKCSSQLYDPFNVSLLAWTLSSTRMGTICFVTFDTKLYFSHGKKNTLEKEN